ncbi:uncharacterized protein PV09_08772 [Verruconis gallopava]|uniref:Zn(2)-C6 fungal-type domain-containing protein n=1 Tax=Verruconis gallopava TaxID=253628 RepID=A0A0D1YFS7_9PEZI|nr:uncharacterized protein PV09_08772 [Verruconis gallopava]KIV99596.1 hypothetical protein PV09_08772 [Verruconis gallopava]
MMAIDAGRKRRTWTRSKRGCRTCRLRHVKCDEAYPSCRRCLSAGRICDGCAAPSDDWEVVTVSSIGTSPDRRPSPARYDGQAADCFAFFQRHTVEYLTGLLDQDWKQLLLQASEHSDAIYHAALAMGSMHRTVLSRQSLSVGLEEDPYAVKQYTKSLRMLAPARNNDQSISADIVLSACLLFIGFESLRRNYGVMLEHVRSGVRIVQQCQQNAFRTDGCNIIPMQKFVPAFARLERQKQELTGDLSPLIADLFAKQTASGFFEYSSTMPQPVPCFSNLDEAWTSLHVRWHSLFRWVNDVRADWLKSVGENYHGGIFEARADTPLAEELEQRSRRLRHDFEVWYLGVKDLRARLGSLSTRDASVYTLLESHALLADIVLSTAGLPRELMWDNHTQTFDRLVKLCRTVMENEAKSSSVSSDATTSSPITVLHRHAPSTRHGAHHSLTFEMGVCMILIQVCLRCRDARIRLNAIKLFEKYPRLEGLWDGTLIARISRSIDAYERGDESLEEAAARGATCDEIPLSRRIVQTGGTFYTHSRSGELILYKAIKHGDDDPGLVRKIHSW